MDYVPNTESDRKEMLTTIGVGSSEELYVDIPDSIMLKNTLNIKGFDCEVAVQQHVQSLSERNVLCGTNFLGAGSYHHFVPSTVDHIVRRGEFFSAYTPYQPEISQGMLQAIYEYQTVMCDLTGMDVANASMYDGSTALAESMLMAAAITRKTKVLVSKCVHPEYMSVLKTYADARDLELHHINFSEDGRTSLDELQEAVDDTTAAVIVQNPNFFGCLEDLKQVGEIAHEKGALFLMSTGDITSLGLLKPPASYDVDILTGEAQCFGLPPSFGGPSLGLMSTKKDYIRKIPGRLAGLTTDEDGRRGFVLTLQAREQHIRREKATSNICTNQGLIMLASLVGMVTLGKEGVKKMSTISASRAKYFHDKIQELDNFETIHSAPYYNEFVVKCRDAKDTLSQLRQNNIIGGLDLGTFYPEMQNHLLFCVTEMIPKEEIDRTIEVMRGL